MCVCGFRECCSWRRREHAWRVCWAYGAVLQRQMGALGRSWGTCSKGRGQRAKAHEGWRREGCWPRRRRRVNGERVEGRVRQRQARAMYNAFKRWTALYSRWRKRQTSQPLGGGEGWRARAE